MRLNEFAEAHLNEYTSKKGVKKAIKRGEILVNANHVEGGRFLKEDDIITIVDIEQTPPKVFPIDLPVIYEDDFIAVINKPAGLTVSGNQYKTVLNALGHNLKQSKSEDALPWPQPAHRLDNQTSGLLLIAKTAKARIELGNAFEEKRITKTYAAILIGKLAEAQNITFPIDNKPSASLITPLRYVSSLKNEFLTLVELNPFTGRTHQLRIHSAKIGHPILGDKLYGDDGMILKNKGLFLTAKSLTFQHPINGEEIIVTIELPTKFSRRLENEERRFNKYKLK